LLDQYRRPDRCNDDEFDGQDDRLRRGVGTLAAEHCRRNSQDAHAELLANDRSNTFSRMMLTPNAIERCRTILQHTHIKWAALGYEDAVIDELVEFLLRMIQSMVIAPPDPPRSSGELRAYLHR
jgi:hypothetical protein